MKQESPRRKKYTKPTISIKKLRTHFFNSSGRFFDSLDELLIPSAMASGGSCCCGGCFIKGTHILLPDKTYKEIQDFKIGEKVLSYNLHTGEVVIDKVVELLTHTEYPGGYFIINNFLSVTGNHQVFVINKSAWDRVENLKEDDILLNPDGGDMLIKTIEKTDGINTVYNLHLNGRNHNYFAENVLVHNGAK